jgi:hypothetical protein
MLNLFGASSLAFVGSFSAPDPCLFSLLSVPPVPPLILLCFSFSCSRCCAVCRRVFFWFSGGGGVCFCFFLPRARGGCEMPYAFAAAMHH